jgi:hypothetical protein
MTGGFSQSPLKLNTGLGQLADWNEAAIEERAGRLAALAITVWAAPILDAAVLAEYSPQIVRHCRRASRETLRCWPSSVCDKAN